MPPRITLITPVEHTNRTTQIINLTTLRHQTILRSLLNALVNTIIDASGRGRETITTQVLGQLSQLVSNSTLRVAILVKTMLNHTNS